MIRKKDIIEKEIQHNEGIFNLHEDGNNISTNCIFKMRHIIKLYV